MPADIKKFKVKPADAVNVAFVIIQMDGEVSEWGTRPQAQRVKGAMQVKMCKDGSVAGITSTMPLHDDYAQVTECGGKDTFLKMDALFRKTVAFTRFELAKRFEGSDNANCTNSGNWSSARCMNSLFSSTPATQCHYVDLKVVPTGIYGANIFVFQTDGATFENRFAIGSAESAESRTANTDGNGAYDCADDECTVKICRQNLKLSLTSKKGEANRGVTSATFSWKNPSDDTNVEAVFDPTTASGTQRYTGTQCFHGESCSWGPKEWNGRL